MKKQTFFNLVPFLQNQKYSIFGEINRGQKFLEISVKIQGDVSEILDRFDKGKIFTQERKPDLWKSSCFEVFLKESFSSRYREWNFSFNGHWDYIDFEDYRRKGIQRDLIMKPKIQWTQSALELQGDLKIPVSENKIRIGIASILKSSSETSYWSLGHFQEKPDFHDVGSFCVII